jgi:aspartyl protease family protein
MSDGQFPQLLLMLLLLIFPLMALFSRRISFGNIAKMVATWLFIFGAFIVIFSFRDQLKTVWGQVKTELGMGGNQVVSNGKIRIPMRGDGHFWADVEINGQKHSMMIDTGATTTAFSASAAKGVNLDADMSGFPSPVETANGTVKAYRTAISKLKVCPIVRNDFPVIVLDGAGDTSVLGMDFLTSLKSWKVDGKTLVLN